MNWKPKAAALAATATHNRSRWRNPIATVPRHPFMPNWWEHDGPEWSLRKGPDDPQYWADSAYSHTSLVTSVAGRHADKAAPGDRVAGRPTSSATLPRLLVRMLQHAHIADTDHILDVGTGSGYGTALATTRLGEQQVTSVDVDPYLTTLARERLASIGLHPTLKTLDATTDELPDTYDRIVATVAIRPIPATWLTALRPGGRLVTTITGTSLIITADKHDDGGARGVVEWDRAGFMHSRHSPGNYPDDTGRLLADAHHLEGHDVRHGPYPVVDVAEAWDLASMLDITTPGIVHDYQANEGQQTAVMAHPDGSWARATATGTGRPIVHQGGPQRLWDALEECQDHWLIHGELPIRGARVRIRPDGTTLLKRGAWRAQLT